MGCFTTANIPSGAPFQEQTLVENMTLQQVPATNQSVCSFSIDLSIANPIYGNSNTVQPPAIQLIPQIKY